MNASSRLRSLLSERGMTQFELSKMAGVSYRTVYNVLAGQSDPRPSILGRLAAALRVSPDYLLGQSASPTVYPEGGHPPLILRDAHPKPPADMREAIAVIARQLHVPEAKVADRVADLVRDCVHHEKEPS